MKNPIRTTLAAITLAASSSASLAISPSGYVFTFDENGNGTAVLYVSSPIATNPVPYQVMSDPTGGITSSPVLIYFLPVQVMTGDVALITGPPYATSDLIRFITPAGSNTSMMIFYSDLDGPPSSLADVGIPPFDIAPAVVEDNGAALWHPGANPGGPVGVHPVGYDLIYTFISEVPEPASTTLLLAGFGALIARREFRRPRRSCHRRIRG